MEMAAKAGIMVICARFEVGIQVLYFQIKLFKKLLLPPVSVHMRLDGFHGRIVYFYDGVAGFFDVSVYTASHRSQNRGALTGFFLCLCGIYGHFQNICLYLLPGGPFCGAAGGDHFRALNAHLIQNLHAFLQVVHDAFHGSPDDVALLMLHAHSEIDASGIRVHKRSSLSGQERDKQQSLRAGRRQRGFPVQVGIGSGIL